jgi:hypothetical protein
VPSGATGYGITTLVAYAASLAERGDEPEPGPSDDSAEEQPQA